MRKIKTLSLLMLTVMLLLAGCGKTINTTKNEIDEPNESVNIEQNSSYFELGVDYYLADVIESYDASSFLFNVVHQIKSDENPGYVGQMFFALPENAENSVEKITPGTVVRMAMKGREIQSVVAATEDEINIMNDIRSRVSTYDDDIEYIKELPASEINLYANSVFHTWTYKQIEMYQAEIAKMLEDEEFAREFNAQEIASKVLTAEQRSEDYIKNKSKYEPWRADDEVIREVQKTRDLDTLTEFDPYESYTDEEIDHLVKIGALIVNEDDTWSYPDGTPVTFDSHRELTPEQQAIVDEYNALFGDDSE